MKRRLFSLLLCGAIIFSLLPTQAFAMQEYTHGELVVQTDDPSSYTVAPESEGSDIYDLILLPGAQITLSGDGSKFNIFVAENAQNVSITLDNFTTTRPTQNIWGHRSGIFLRERSAAVITLVGTNSIRAGWESSAIRVCGTASLTIDGDGVLNASIDNGSNGALAAVIGGHFYERCGDITINGGTINAQTKSPYAAAAIGAASRNNLGGGCGTIALNGGVINANAIGGVGNSSAVVTGSGGAVVNTDLFWLKGDTSGFNGIIWNGDTGTVYGNAVVGGLAVGAGKTLTVPEGTTLTVPEGETLQVEGVILLKGTLVNNGDVTGEGQIVTSGGSMTGGGTSDISPDPCAHTNVSFVPVDESSHRKVCLFCGGELPPEPHKEGLFCVVCGYGASPIGDNAYYIFDSETKELHIYGTGSLWSYQDLLQHSNARGKWINSSQEAASVVIHEGITGIGQETFYWSEQMEAISLPLSLREIGSYAFTSRNKLSSVVIPPNVTNASDAFRYCSSLEMICTPDGLEVKNNSATTLTYELTDDGAVIKTITLGSGKASVTLPTELFGKPVLSHPHIGEATCTATGICAACGERYTAPHSYTDWQTDESDHWQTCTICSQSTEHTPHIYNDASDPTCNECGYERAIYTVTVLTEGGGTGGGGYAEGTTVTITATAPEGKRFAGWTVNEGGVTLADACSATTTFTMPAQAVAVTANFGAIPTGGGSSGGYIPPTPPTPPTYPPAVERPGEGGGTPVISPSNPKQGDTVTVTPKPDEGYEVDEIIVTDKNGKPVAVTKKPDGTYTFVQPGGQVTIEIEYAPVPLTGLPWNTPFTDVDQGDWYYEAVRFVQENGLMNGYSDGQFAPNDPLSRAQLAQILFNKEGRPGVNYLLTFSDVAGEVWYTEAIRWAASQGIVGGYGNGTFGPNDPITREQLAVMLWRYSGSPAATNKELHFNDADEISPFALEALRWAVENGILNGYGDGRLGPQGQATRAQVAQMLKNFIEDQENKNNT